MPKLPNNTIRAAALVLATALFCAGLFAAPVRAADEITLYFFYGDGCPHCAKEEVFLDRLVAERPNIAIRRFETWHSVENAKLLAELGKRLGVTIPGVPMLFIGTETVAGYFDDETTGRKIVEILDRYEETGCTDVVGALIRNEPTDAACVHGCTDGDAECRHDCGCSADTGTATPALIDTVSIPFFGTVSAADVSLPVLTLVVAAADGFNPCAMWVLVFLISLLVTIEEKRRRWALGLAFIVTSGTVYFLFLSAWLNLFLFLGYVSFIRTGIGLVALVGGGLNLKDAWDYRDGGCHVVEGERRKKLISRVRALVAERRLWPAFVGIVGLAAAVNMVELVCSAGLPAVYTQVLSLAALPVWQYYAYLVAYILVFMSDDIAIFVIAMVTLEITNFGGRLAKFSGWVGGAIMIVIGLLLLFKPGLLMFG